MPYARRPSYPLKRKRSTYRRSAAASRIQRVFRKRRVAPALTRKIKTVTLSQCETKKSSAVFENEQLSHNKTFYYTGMLRTTQGVSAPDGNNVNQDNRIGDEVIGRGLALKVWLESKVDHPNTKYRVVVFKYNPLATPTIDDSIFWNGLNGGGADMNRMLDTVNSTRIKILKSFILQNVTQTGIGNNDLTRPIMGGCYISLGNKKIKYNVDSGTEPWWYDIGMAVLAYDSFGTLETDLVGNISWRHNFYYKDP